MVGAIWDGDPEKKINLIDIYLIFGGIYWVCIKGKWRFRLISYWKYTIPDGDWHPGQGDNRYIAQGNMLKFIS